MQYMQYKLLNVDESLSNVFLGCQNITQQLSTIFELYYYALPNRWGEIRRKKYLASNDWLEIRQQIITDFYRKREKSYCQSFQQNRLQKDADLLGDEVGRWRGVSDVFFIKIISVYVKQFVFYLNLKLEPAFTQNVNLLLLPYDS